MFAHSSTFNLPLLFPQGIVIGSHGTIIVILPSFQAHILHVTNILFSEMPQRLAFWLAQSIIIKVSQEAIFWIPDQSP